MSWKPVNGLALNLAGATKHADHDVWTGFGRHSAATGMVNVYDDLYETPAGRWFVCRAHREQDEAAWFELTAEQAAEWLAKVAAAPERMY
jgi:hypothetical protein